MTHYELLICKKSKRRVLDNEVFTFIDSSLLTEQVLLVYDQRGQ